MLSNFKLKIGLWAPERKDNLQKRGWKKFVLVLWKISEGEEWMNGGER